ncbi:hypothetical protein ACXZ1M_12155 [Duganella sp. PWIR1]|jgi:hypothetical protein
MAIEKVLLMHGPADLEARPPYPDELFYPHVAYDARPGIRLMAIAFRALGFKIAYSGWEEDGPWLRENAALFDFLVVSDQHRLNTDSNFFGKVIGNNKEKLYYATLAGIRAVRAGLGDDVVVYRVRADVTVHQGVIDQHVAQIRRHSGDIMVEYCDVKNMFSTPDFMLLGEVGVLDAIYTGLYERSRAGEAYHVSSHIDHTMAFFALQEQGVVGNIMCMNRQVHDTVIWRGLPRHFQEINPTLQATRAFATVMTMGPGLTVAQLLAQIAPGASGRNERVKPPTAL